MMAPTILVAVAGVLFWAYWTSPASHASAPQIKPPSEPVSIVGLPYRGSATAKVVMIEFADFECPFCRQFASTTMPSIQERYITTGLVGFVFRNLPLRIHPSAMGAAQATACAFRQDQFWPVYDGLFDGPGPPDAERVQLVTNALPSFDVAQFKNCLNQEASTMVTADISAASAVGLSGTPNFLIGLRLPNGTVQISDALAGAARLDQLTNIFDSLLKIEK